MIAKLTTPKEIANSDIPERQTEDRRFEYSTEGGNQRSQKLLATDKNLKLESSAKNSGKKHPIESFGPEEELLFSQAKKIDP